MYVRCRESTLSAVAKYVKKKKNPNHLANCYPSQNLWGGFRSQVGGLQGRFQRDDKKKKKGQNAKISRKLSFSRVHALGSFPPTPGKDAAPDGSFGVALAQPARTHSHVAPVEGSAPEPAALIGPRLPGSRMHLNVVQTKRAMSSHAGNSQAAGPACWPHEHKHLAAPAHVGLAHHKCCLPPPHIGQFSPQRWRRFHLQLFGLRLLSSCHDRTLTRLALPRVPPLSPVAPPPWSSPPRPWGPPFLTPPNPRL